MLHQVVMVIMMYSLFIKVDSVVMHATSITTASRMLPVFACGAKTNTSVTQTPAPAVDEPPPGLKLTNATVSVAHVSAELPGLRLLGGLMTKKYR